MLSTAQQPEAFRQEGDAQHLSAATSKCTGYHFRKCRRARSRAPHRFHSVVGCQVNHVSLQPGAGFVHCRSATPRNAIELIQPKPLKKMGYPDVNRDESVLSYSCRPGR